MFKDFFKRKETTKYKAGVARSKYGNAMIFAVLMFFGAFMLFPFVYGIIQSIKPLEEIFIYPPRFFVMNPTLENFILLYQLSDSLWIPFIRYFTNSIVVTVLGTVLNLVVSSVAAFPLAKYDFPGSKILFKIIIASLLFAGPVTALPQYVIIAKLGMINTHWAVVFPAVAAPLGIFLMKNFMVQIDNSMLESAKIDGAGIFRTFYSIALPIVKPAAFTLVIFTFQALWRSTGGVYIYDEEMKLLPTILDQIASAGMARIGVGAAAAVMMMIPSFVIFILLQSRVIQTMAHSGIKG